MVQSKAEREKQKQLTDKCQSQIEALLREDDNKYCVDCDAKGPRWASWNLGIFLCIRCAGIHRNLGVHISRVKSVNLDAWKPEHVTSMQKMGNSKARLLYEANLPEDFRRPQTDSALESFIRAKYEHKKYIASDFEEQSQASSKPQQQEQQQQAAPVLVQTSTPTTSSLIPDTNSSNLLSADLMGDLNFDTISTPTIGNLTATTTATNNNSSSGANSSNLLDLLDL